jgi:phytoene desaturase
MQVVVIGAGVGGMAAALRLAHAGHRVTVLEQNESVGGKLNVWEPDVPGAGTFRFDTGPHVLTMPWAIESLFRDLGRNMADYLDLVRVDPICRYHFADERVFDAPADPDEAAGRVADTFPGDEQGFRDLLAYARRVYDTTVEPFLCQDFGQAVRGIPSPAQWRQLGQFLGLAPWKTLHERVKTHLRHPRLRQIFDLYAFYNGSSPFRASNIFAIIAWVQWGQGTYYLRGGLRTYADALAHLADELGVEVRLNTRVKRVCVEKGRILGVEVENGGCVPADIVICNADPLTAFSSGLVPEGHRPRAFRDEAALSRVEPSTSAFVLLLGVRGEAARDFGHLSHYNSFLPDDGAAEFAPCLTRACRPTIP